MNEKEMREADVPQVKNSLALADYVDTLTNRHHDYGTCVYAMSMAAVAAFNLVAHKLGVTGFQASCADMDILRRLRQIKGGFIILKTEDLLYPQYNLREKLEEFITDDETQKWLTEEAQKLLSKGTENAHPNVVAHWKKLAGA